MTDAAALRPLIAGELRLEPSTIAHADEMFDVLGDPLIYTHLDHGPPPSREHLRDVYARLAVRRSPDGTQGWFNWIVRARSGDAIGVVQATTMAPRTAWVAWVFASRHWGRGHAQVATRAMIDHLVAAHHVVRCLATVQAANARSIALLKRLGFRGATPAEASGHDLTTSERLYVRTIDGD